MKSSFSFDFSICFGFYASHFSNLSIEQLIKNSCLKEVINLPEVVVNNVAVLVAAVVSMILGAIWHGPLFGKTWMKAAGVTKADIEKDKKEMPMMYAITFVGTLVTAYVLAVFIGWVGANTIALAVILSFLF